MNSSRPNISVVICTYNRASYILDAIDSLNQQTLPKDKFEVIVVDNNSSDSTGQLVQEYAKIHSRFRLFYVMELNQGATFARNTGASLAGGELLCFMDDDAIAEREYLKKVLDFFRKYPNAAGLGGRIIPRYIPFEPAWMSHYVSSMVGNFHYSNSVTEFRNGKYPLESNMIVKKKDFDAIGGFNTALLGVKGSLRIGGEGKDFFLRLQREGKRIYYDPSVIVHHVVEVKKLTPEYLYSVASGYGRGEKVRTLAISKLAYWSKIAEYVFKFGAACILALVYIAKGRPAQSWPVIRFRIDALKGLLEN